ncbi:hypothetical protein E2C01_090274 [Portunus trituberculatus]|uniref:Uncharacterized protein n=1 Tax=Portunus trituberculatus TaxID=210409 RepID=A0A5B7JPQ4_PORTR|nr:hypothetical protein [Portunus trituberculatus]
MVLEKLICVRMRKRAPLILVTPSCVISWPK